MRLVPSVVNGLHTDFGVVSRLHVSFPSARSNSSYFGRSEAQQSASLKMLS